MTLQEFEYLNKKLYGVTDYKISRLLDAIILSGEKETPLLASVIENYFSNKFLFSYSKMRLLCQLNQEKSIFINCGFFFRLNLVVEYLRKNGYLDSVIDLSINPVVSFPRYEVVNGVFKTITNAYSLSGDSPISINQVSSDYSKSYVCPINSSYHPLINDTTKMNSIIHGHFESDYSFTPTGSLFPALIRNQGTRSDTFECEIQPVSTELFGADVFLIEYSPDVKIW